MCGCFVLALGAFAPRLALLLMALFNDVISRAFDDSWALALAGWLLLPYTTLIYVLIFWYEGAVEGFSWAFVVFGFVLDIASYSGAAYNRRTAAYSSGY